MLIGLRGKVVLASGAAVLAAVLATAAVASYFFVERQTTVQASRAMAIADALAIQLERELSSGAALADVKGFDERCDEAVARHGNLSYALVVDAAAAVRFRSESSNTPQPELPPLPSPGAPAGALLSPDGRAQLALAAVHGPGGQVAGQVVVGFSRAAVLAERNQLLLRIVAAGLGVMAVVLGVLAVGLQRLVVRPLARIVRAMDRMRRGEQDPTLRHPARGRDELAVLREGFNALVQTVARREHDLLAAKEAAEQGGRTKTQFMAVMSHELRTPLNAVIGMAELLANTRLDERQRRFVAQIRASGRDLVEIVNDVLDLTHLQGGRLRVLREPFHLRDALFDTVERYREGADARELTLTLHVDESLPDLVAGDLVHLRQVLSNLLSNALKFTERGGVIVRVTPSQANVAAPLGLTPAGGGPDTVRPRGRAEGFVRFSVSDTGVGVPPDFMPHVYEAFRQADSAPTRRFGGVGLGLAIARRLCEAMGGRIDASSRPGKGSTFWFELPLPAVEGQLETPRPVQPERAAQAVAANEPLPHAGASALQVLVVEDDLPNQRLALDTLAQIACQVTVAGDGTQAQRWVRKRRFDLVLLDWQLPEVDGLAVLAALREAEAAQGWPRTRVVAVTAHTNPGDRETCLAAGADDYLGKPYTPADLLGKVALGSDALQPSPRR